LAMVVLLGLRCLRRAYMAVAGLLKVAGFRAPIGGWFCAPADRSPRKTLFISITRERGKIA
jgi:hypothetical protein